eukprot:scaffold12350_cov192-Isochrysis_galbana.AAC.2
MPLGLGAARERDTGGGGKATGRAGGKGLRCRLCDWDCGCCGAVVSTGGGGAIVRSRGHGAAGGGKIVAGHGGHGGVGGAIYAQLGGRGMRDGRGDADWAMNSLGGGGACQPVSIREFVRSGGGGVHKPGRLLGGGRVVRLFGETRAWGG